MAQRCGTALALWLLVPADDHRGAARGLEAAQAGSGPTPAGLVGGSDLFRSATFCDQLSRHFSVSLLECTRMRPVTD